MQTLSKKSKIIYIITGLMIAAFLFFAAFNSVKALSLISIDYLISDWSEDDVDVFCSYIDCTQSQKTQLYEVIGEVPSEGYVFTQFMMRGSSSSEVQKLQEFLNDYQGANLVVDGKFGRGTEAAVIVFQASIGLQADGKVGKNTRATLNQLQNPPCSPGAPGCMPPLSITILFPNGGEVWQNGQTYTVSWDAQNVSANTWIGLTVHGNIIGYNDADIRYMPLSGNSYSWTIPVDTFCSSDMCFMQPLIGTNLKVKAALYDATGITNPCFGYCPAGTTPQFLISDESDGVFTITL